MRIGIDLMGSDKGHTELFEAVLDAAKLYGSVSKFHLFVTKEVKTSLYPLAQNLPVVFHLADEVISMDDDPIRVIRQKKNATLIRGIKALKSKKIDLFISGGNTGALISASALFLPKLPGIKRPALLATLPTAKGVVTLIDAGGNVQMKASLFYQYALMGSSYHEKKHGKKEVKVGLLNVGIESKKGTLEHRAAFEKLSEIPGFMGNIEPQSLFSGDVDVVVTDGFTGNVLLKTAEGVSEFIFNQLKLNAPEAMHQEIAKLSRRFEYADFPGARVMGVEGDVIKIHGSAGPEALSICLKALHSNI